MSAQRLHLSELEPRLPRTGLKVVRPEVDTGKPEDQYRKWLSVAIRSAPIWHFWHKQRRYCLVRPLLIRVRQDEEFFFAENETLRLVGTGMSTEDALSDFCVHLVHFHEFYARLPESRLTGEAIRLKQVFHGLFVEEP